MKACFRYIFFLLPFLFSQITCMGEDQKQQDLSSDIEVRKVDPSKLNKYAKDPDYIYDRVPPKAESWWSSVKKWFWESIEKLFGKEYAGDVIDIIFYLLIAGALVFIILKVLKANMNTVFRKESHATPSIGYTVSDEDINEIDFEEHIKKAREKKNYREVIRLSYLKILKALSDQDIINWKKDKTNFEYYGEIGNENIKARFGRISKLYEYIWYGDFKLKEEDFKETYSEFRDFNKNISI